MKDAKTKKINKVFLDGRGIIRSIYYGPQSAERLRRTNDKIMRIMNKLVHDDKPVKLLADIRQMGEYDQPARLVEMQARTNLPFWKMAIITGSSQTAGEKMSRIFTAMSGRRGEIRYFNREDDAIGWMAFMRRNEHDPPHLIG